MDQDTIVRHAILMNEKLAQASGFKIDKSIGTAVNTNLNDPIFNIVALEQDHTTAFAEYVQSVNASFLSFPGKLSDSAWFPQLMELNQLIRIDTVAALYYDNLQHFQNDNKAPQDRIKPVTTLADFLKFNEIASLSFDYNFDNGLQYFKKLIELNFKLENVYLFLIMDNGTAVGTTLIFINDNIAGLYWGSVHPNSRKLGLASEAILAYMAFVRDLGLDTIVCQNMTPSINACMRLGFKKIAEIPLYAHIKE